MSKRPSTMPLPAAAAGAAAAAGPVVLTATDAVWIEIKDGATVLKQGQLAPGETFEVPANAAAPVLTTGKPEALRISVGTAAGAGRRAAGPDGVGCQPEGRRPDATRGGAGSGGRSAASRLPPVGRAASRRPGAPGRRRPPAETPDPRPAGDGNTPRPTPGTAGRSRHPTMIHRRDRQYRASLAQYRSVD